MRASGAKSCINIHVLFWALVLSACLSNDGAMVWSSCVMNWGRELSVLGGDATMSVLGGKVTTGGSVVDARIFWGSVVVVLQLVLGGKSCILCFLFCSWVTLICS